MNKKKLEIFFKEKRKDFPILNQKINSSNLIYVDNGATTQKPKIVIDTISNYYKTFNSNIHRGVHTLSEKATTEYEKARKKVAEFLSANSNEIIFTSGATQSANLIAFGLKHLLSEGDEIILSKAEHHANLIPWQEVAKHRKCTLKFVDFDPNYKVSISDLKTKITSKTKIIAITHISNVLGVINPIEKIIKIAKKNNILTVIDAAQSIPHMKINVKKLDCDFLFFSAHKMCGPCGVGVLYGKKEKLNILNPLNFGGNMIEEVELKTSTYTSIPNKFEAGTPNIEGALGFAKAIEYLDLIGFEKIEKYEKLLTQYLMKKIEKIPNLNLVGPSYSKDKMGVISFTFKNIHSHDISSILNQYGIAVRGGHHCAMPLHSLFNISSSSRISLYFYNTFEEMDKISDILSKLEKIYNSGEFLKYK